MIYHNGIEHRRFLSSSNGNAPWYSDFIVVVGIGLIFYFLMKILQAYSNRWKRMMKRRVEKALEQRKAHKDSFRFDNGYSWDYVMVFKVYLPTDKLTEAQKNPSTSLKGIVTLLYEAGLQAKLFYSVQNDEVYCKIRAPMGRIMKEADRVNYRLQLDPIQIANALQNGHMIGPIEKQWKPVKIPMYSLETDIEPFDYIYSAFDTNNADANILYKKGSNGTIFRGVDRMRLIAGIIKARREEGGCHLDVYKLVTTGCLIAFFPLHDYVELRALEAKWIRFLQFPWRQHVDDVKDYFGEKIGMFFLWLGHCTTWLISAAFFGFIAWCFVAAADNNPNSPVMPYFAAFISIWATLFLEFWKRKEKYAALRWGTIGFEETEQDRPQFQGELKPSPCDGSDSLYFPTHIYRIRVIKSTTVVLFMILLVIGIVAAIFYFKIVMTLSHALVVGNVQLASTIASLLNAVQIQVMNYIYGNLSVKLNEYENHRTDTIYEDALIGKTFMFQFVNSFAALFYISFVKPFIPTMDPCNPSCMVELQNALSTIFLTRLVTGNFLKILLPYLDQRNRQQAEMKGVKSSDGKHVSEVEKLFMLAPFSNLDLFADYANQIIQFGYTTMFIVAFPLATVMSFVNNYVEMRVDAWKLCQLCRRPEPRGCEDIGTWATILEIMGVSAVMINAGLVAFTGSVTSEYTWPGRIWVFIGMAFVIMFTKFLVAVAIPDVPLEVEIQLKRQEFIVGKVIQNVGDEEEDDAVEGIKNPQYTIRITDDDPL